jgi:DNA cross-link repair 1C protein
VRITPIVSRHNGFELAELGTGGGHGDLAQQHELELYDSALVGKLLDLCVQKLQGQEQLRSDVLGLLFSALSNGNETISLDNFDAILNEFRYKDNAHDSDDIPIDNLILALARLVTKSKVDEEESTKTLDRRPALPSRARNDGLPRQIVRCSNCFLTQY